MATIQIIKSDKKVQENESEKLYHKIIKVLHKFSDAKKELKELSIEGLKDLLNKLPNKSYNLYSHNIHVLSDELDSNGDNVMVNDIYLDSDVIYINLNNGSNTNSVFANSEFLFCIYGSMYSRYICGNL